MLKKQHDFEIALVGPLVDQPIFVERLASSVYNKVTKKRLVKYYPSSLKSIGKEINQAIHHYQPDVIFSKYSSPVVHATIDRPFVYMCDSTIHWTKKYWHEFSKVGFDIMEKWEEKSILSSDRIITFSDANADVIKSYYRKEPEKVRVMPIPAFIPAYHLPSRESVDKKIGDTLHLLLVGKRFHLRGMDIAIDVVQKLNAEGVPAQLRIVGIKDDNQEFVKFTGSYEKEDPEQIKEYFECYTWADLLIHPSRFHSAGIVISEAAAFGLPTITNASGGLATSVQHDHTGLVLPEGSPAQAYVDSIKSLVDDKDRYKRYRAAARDRFDEILNWEIAGQNLVGIIREVVNT
jgi:glycosyltransferase involved in cell wall biosynthesis